MNGVEVSKRLRDLREHYDNGKPISHVKLAAVLQERYGVKISAQTLKDYERPALNGTTENTTRGSAIYGMSVKYLDMFADFYGVSRDYILGSSDVRSTSNDVKTVCSYTGLSESAVSMLHDLANSTYSKTDNDILKVIDILLSDEYYAHDYWHRIYAFLYTTGDDFSLNVPVGNFPVKRDDLLRTLLELNNEYLARIKNVILTGQGGDKLWQAFV